MKTKIKLPALIIILGLAITFAANVKAQNFGIGVRFGDPSGITVKKYFAKSALELSVGRTYWLYHRGWYDRRFVAWYDEQKFGYKEFQYIGYSASPPIGVQLHYLIRKPISSVGEETTSGLEWYFGFGGQVRYQTFFFDYRYKLEGSPDWFYATGGRVTDLDIGPDGVIGLEYIFHEVPLAVFLDATLFMEIVDAPFIFWFQGGIGGRYNF